MNRYILALCALSITTAEGFNRSLFFRTSSFWGEPRFVKPWLSTMDIQVLGGSNHRSRNECGDRTNLLTLYGCEDVTALSKASVDEFDGKPLELPGNPERITFKAVADVFEADINWYQNFCYGFFAQFHLPVFAIRICPSGFIEPEECEKPSSKYCPVWQQPIEELNPFLEQFNIHTCNTDEGGLSDSTLFLGWSYSYEDTCYLDFIDTTIKTGVLFPTGKERDRDQLFSIPFGYDGFYAVPLSWDITFGAFDWMTFGFHTDSLFFFKKTQCLRMRTPDEALTGTIVLGKGLAEVKPGIVWRMGTYFKADHFFGGLSFLLAFAYEQKNKSIVTPCDTEQFNACHVTNDPRFDKWARSLVHLQLEYDFAKEDSCVGTRFGIFYDQEMTGLRVFNINPAGGYLGIDVAWVY